MVADGDDIKIGAPHRCAAPRLRPPCCPGRGDKVHIFKMRRRKHYPRARAIARTTPKCKSPASPHKEQHNMAHKKAGGSSRNGRDSESKRLGVKRYGGELVRRATSSCASAAPSSTRASTSASARTTPCSPRLTARSSSGQGRSPAPHGAHRAGRWPDSTRAEPTRSPKSPVRRIGLFYLCAIGLIRSLQYEIHRRSQDRGPRRQGRRRQRLVPPREVHSLRRARRRRRRSRRQRVSRWPTATSTRWSSFASRASSTRKSGENGRGAQCYGKGGEDIDAARAGRHGVHRRRQRRDGGRPRRGRPDGLPRQRRQGRPRQPAFQVQHQPRAAPAHAGRAGRGMANWRWN